MRTWTTATRLMMCGKHMGWIQKGEPIQMIHLAAHQLPKVRCVACADTSPPDWLDVPDVPAEAVVAAPEPSGMTRLGLIQIPTYDVKMRQAGEDDE